MKPEGVIVDMDGTLVDVSSIRHLVVPDMPGSPGYKNFDHFHKASVWCPPIVSTIEWCEEHAWEDRGIIVVTARREFWKPQTKGWLDGKLDYDELHMRRDDDYRSDVEVKRDILADVRRRWDIVACIDDNPAVISLWLSEGIATTVVPGWYTGRKAA